MGELGLTRGLALGNSCWADVKTHVSVLRVTSRHKLGSSSLKEMQILTTPMSLNSAPPPKSLDEETAWINHLGFGFMRFN